MGKYLSPLNVELIDGLAAAGRGIWRIEKPFHYVSDILGVIITVEVGFYTDFASVPRAPIIYWLFGDTDHEAAVLHDWLFHHHEVCDEQTANKVLLEASKAAGVSWWRRTGIYLGVVFGGRSSWIHDGLGDGHRIVDGEIV